MVSALCRLHNFLIDNGSASAPALSEDDTARMVANGAVDMVERDGVLVAETLADVGHHRDDWSTADTRRVSQQYGDELLPRSAMFEHIRSNGFRRPEANRR